MYRYACSFFLYLSILVGSLPTWAMAVSWPQGIQLGADLLRPLQYKYGGRQGTQYELSTAVDFSHWILAGDYGWGSIGWEGYNRKTETASAYTSEGQYFRIGLNYNFLQYTPVKNMAFAGLRYAGSFFKDRLIIKVHDGSSGIMRSTQDHVKAHWLEAVAGVKVKVWGLLYVGSTFRYKFGLHLDRANIHIPYDILGWGLNDTKSCFGFNLYLLVRIPFVRNTYA